jgi:hypothetical protein
LTARRRCLVAMGVVGVVLAGLTGLAVSPTGERQLALWARDGLQGALAEGWTADLPTFSWGLDGRVIVEGIGLRAPDGHVVISVRRVDLAVDLTEIGALRVRVRGPKVDGVVVDLTTDADGVLDLLAAFGAPFPEEEPSESAPWEGLPISVQVDGLSLRDVQVVYRGQPTLVWEDLPATQVAQDPAVAGAVGALHTLVTEVVSAPTLEGGPEEPPMWIPRPVVRVSGVQVASLSLSADLFVPRGRPAAHLTALKLGGALLSPGPTLLQASGDVHWEDEDLTIDQLVAQLGATRLRVDGGARALSTDMVLDLVVDAEPLDLGALDALAGIGLDGTYAGRLMVQGPLAELGLSGTLTGAEGTKGALEVLPGTVICLPQGSQGMEAGCGAPADPATEPVLRWSAGLRFGGVDVNDILPVIGAPIVLDGVLTARGHGTSWPDGLVVEGGRWDAGAMDVYHVPVRSLGADLSLSGGVLYMDGLDVTGVAGTVRGTGTLDFKTMALDIDANGPLDLAMLEDMGVKDLRGRGTYRAKVHGDLTEPGVPFNVQGWISAGPLSWGDQVHVAKLSGPVSVRVFEGVTRVNAGGAKAEGVDAYGATAAHLTLAELGVVVDDRIRVQGRGVIPRVEYGTAVWFDAVEAGFTYLQVDEAPMRVDADVRVGPHALADLPGTQGTIDVALVGSDLGLDVDLRWEEEPFLIAPGFRMNLESQVIDIPEVLFQPTSRQSWRAEGPIHLRLVEGGIADADIVIASTLGRIEIDGALGTQGQLGGRVRVTDFELSSLAELFPFQLSDLSGRVNSAMALRGRASEPEIDLQIDGQNLILSEDLTWLDVEGQVRVREHVATVGLGLGVDGVPLARIEGFAPLRSDLASPGLSDDGAADLRVVIEPGDLERFELLLGDQGLPEGVVSGRLDVTGDMHDPDLAARVIVETELPRGGCCGRIELDLQRQQGQLVTHLDLYEGLAPAARIDGTATTRFGEIMAWLVGDAEAPTLSDVSLYADDLSVQGELVELPVESVLAALGIELDLVGELIGNFEVRGSPLRPELVAGISMTGAAAGEPLDLRLDLAPEREGYHLDLALGREEARWVTVVGHVPARVDLSSPPEAWSTGVYALELGGDGVPLTVARAALTDLEVDRGVVRVSGGLAGSLLDPSPDLDVTLVDGLVRYRPLGLRVSGAEAVVHVIDDPKQPDLAGAVRIDVERLRAVTTPIGVPQNTLGGDPGFIDLGGSISTLLGAVGEVDLDLRLKRAWLMHLDDAQLQATGALTVHGPWPEIAVAGNIDVDQAFYDFDAAELMQTRDLRLDPRITMHHGPTLATRREEAEVASFVDTLDLDVGVGLWGNVRTRAVMPVLEDFGSFGARLTRLDVQTGLAGALDVQMRRGDLSIEGEVKLTDGVARLLQARFELDGDSTVELTGRDYADPQLRVRGTMAVTGGEVELELGGTAQDLELTLTSDEFKGDAELFTVLLTGQAPEDLSAEQGQGAIQAVSDLLLNSVLGGVKLGSVSVEADGTVRVGVPLGRVVFVETSLDPAAPVNQNLITVEGEFRVLPRLVLDVAYGNRLIWANVFWETRF